jgi:hypothetical protein
MICKHCGEPANETPYSMAGTMHKYGPTTHEFKARKPRAFHITYETYSDDSIEAGDADQRGFTARDVLSLRDALDICDWSGATRPEADSAPISVANPPRWFSADGVGYVNGYAIHRSLHLVNVTPSSAMRIARIIGARGVR